LEARNQPPIRVEKAGFRVEHSTPGFQARIARFVHPVSRLAADILHISERPNVSSNGWPNFTRCNRRAKSERGFWRLDTVMEKPSRVRTTNRRFLEGFQRCDAGPSVADRVLGDIPAACANEGNTERPDDRRGCNGRVGEKGEKDADALSTGEAAADRDAWGQPEGRQPLDAGTNHQRRDGLKAGFAPERQNSERIVRFSPRRYGINPPPTSPSRTIRHYSARHTHHAAARHPPSPDHRHRQTGIGPRCRRQIARTYVFAERVAR